MIKTIVPDGNENYGDPVLVTFNLTPLFGVNGQGTGHLTASINGLQGAREYLARIGDTVTITASAESTVFSPQNVNSAYVGFVSAFLTPVVNRPPVVGAIGNQSVPEGSTLSFAAYATDPDPGQTLTYSLDSAPAGMTIDPATGAFAYEALDGPGSFPVTVRVTDNGSPSLSDEESFTITVNNVAPHGVTLSAEAIDENDFATLNVSFDDPGIFDTHIVSIDWGDGSSSLFALGANERSASFAHKYLDNLPGNAPYTISVAVTDKDGDSGIGQTGLAVRDVAPSNVTLIAEEIDENGIATLSGSFVDPGILDTHSVSIDWGDGSSDMIPLGALEHGFSHTHRYLDNLPGNAPFSIAVVVTDKDGDSGTAVLPLVVRNVRPGFDVLFFPPPQVEENDTVVVSGFINDPGTLDGHVVSVNWSDGQFDIVQLAAGETGFTVARQFPQNADYSVVVAVVDKDGDAVSSKSIKFSVNDVAPVAGIAGPATAAVGQPVTFTLSAADQSPVDQAAGFTFDIDWDGDGEADQSVTGPSGTQMLAADQKCSAAAKTGRRTKSAAHNCAVL